MATPRYLPLETLYAQYDAISRGRDKYGDSAAVHAAILARLAANRLDAEAAGWSALCLQRDGGMGRLRLVGLAPGSMTPGVFPDRTSPTLH